MASPFDIFTGKPAIEAAGQARGTFAGAQGQIGNLADITQRASADFLRGGYQGAREDLTGGYGAATGAIREGAGGALGFLDQGQGGALGRIDQARGGIGGAYEPLTALAGRFGKGSALYSDALGINGPEGAARARGAFTTGPGYDFTMDQGLDAISRRRNATGGTAYSGNADRDAQTFGQGLANQEYGNYLTRLSAFNPLELQATSGAATGTAGENLARGNLDLAGASLLDAGGRARAGVATGQGTQLADIANRYYSGQAGLDTAEGGALAGNMWAGTNPQIAAQTNFAPRIAQTYQDEANASLQGTKNLWGMGLAAAQLAAGMPPTGMGGGSFGGPGGNLGASGTMDPSMWNKTLPAGGFGFG